MHVLITGGAGYLGSYITNQLLCRGYRVRVLDELLHGYASVIPFTDNPDFELITGTVTSPYDIQNAVKGVEVVIHLAAIVGDSACALLPETTIAINALATAMLAQYCKLEGVRKFLFASTCSVYGAGDEIFTEESQLRPVSLYGKSKVHAEQALLSLADSQFQPTILRKGTIYGLSYRMRFDLVVNLLTVRALTEGRITVYGSDQWRPFLHVADAASAYVRCLEAPADIVGSQVFNVGDNTQNFQIIEVGKKIYRCIPSAELVILEEKRDPRNYRVSFDKIEHVLGFRKTLTIEDGVREIMDAFQRGVFKDYRDVSYHNFRPDQKEYYRNILLHGAQDKF